MRIFKGAVEHKNFTRAAEALSLTQPAVTQQVQSLEKIFGRPLFATRGAAELTPLGAAVYERVCRILAEVSRTGPGRDRPGPAGDGHGPRCR
jgi:DNA-binding transcriptional LysR family regulator